MQAESATTLSAYAGPKPALRILHVIRTLDPAWGGPMQGVKHITNQALARRHLPEILTQDDVSAAWISNYSARVNALGSQAQTYGRARTLDKWLNANLHRFDCVVVHGVWHYHSFAVWKATRRIRIPYYLFTHGYLDPWFQRYYPLKHIKKTIYWKAIEHRVVRDAKSVLFTSEEEMRLADKSFRPYQCNPRVIGYGTPPPPPLNRSKQEVIRGLTSQYPHLGGRNFILYLSRIHEKKGVDLLLKAFSEAKGLMPDTALIIAGHGDSAIVEQMKKLAGGLRLQNDLLWLGPVYGDPKWSVMQAAEAYILPSHQENFGISVAESLSCGTPVLVSDKVNIWREIQSGNAGFVAPDDIRGTTELLKQWAQLDTDSKNVMRSKASQCFENHFNITKTADRMFDVFQEA